ncbi:unnamed protein product [Closterium sp. NIES-54]
MAQTVRTASDLLTAIKARYSTPSFASLGRLFLPFLFPALALFDRAADLISHLHSLDTSFRAACTEAQLALLPRPLAITIYFIDTSLPDRLASVRDTLLLKHPSELTINVLEAALKDVESNHRSVASASGTVPPPLLKGCTVPQLPTFTAFLAFATAAATIGGQSRSRGGKEGGKGAGSGRSGGVNIYCIWPGSSGGGSGVGDEPSASTGGPPAVSGGGVVRGGPGPARQPLRGSGVVACTQPSDRSSCISSLRSVSSRHSSSVQVSGSCSSRLSSGDLTG